MSTEFVEWSAYLEVMARQPGRVNEGEEWVPIVRRCYPPAKIVLHMHCEWLTQLDQSMIDRRLGLTDMIIGCSEYVTQKIRRRFPDGVREYGENGSEGFRKRAFARLQT